MLIYKTCQDWDRGDLVRTGTQEIMRLSHWGRDKWLPFCRQHLEVHFLYGNFWIWNKKILKYFPLGLIDNIGSDNGLGPNRRQAIIWSNVGMLYWCICVTRVQYDTNHKCVVHAWKMLIRLGHNFVHAMTAELSWHAQNWDLIDWI